MLRAVEEANNKIFNEKLEKVDIFSMDVKALYPSLDKEDVRRCVEEVMRESNYKIDIVDKRELCKYLALVIDREELEGRGMVCSIPKRYNEGKKGERKIKPTVAYLDSETVKINGEEVEKWIWEEWVEPDGAILEI